MPTLYNTQLGPYEIVHRLGHGGMAETFRAVRRGPGGMQQQVCIKRLLPHRAAEPSTVRAFLREAHLVATLNHPNIVRVLDLGEQDGSPYLALELVDGMDLRALLRARLAMRRPLTPDLVAYLAVQLATALHAAHTAATGGGKRGIYHRDLSPENVLLGRSGEVKLADFGIARPVDDRSTTAAGIVKGKPDYMAPEYAHTGAFDTRCDQYSLGVVLYECLSGGTRPYEGRTELELLQRAAEGGHVPIVQRCPAAPAALCAFVERLLCTKPEARFGSPQAMLEAAHELEPPLRSVKSLAELVDTLAPLPEESSLPSRPSGAQPTSHVKAPGGSGAHLTGRTKGLVLAAFGGLTLAALFAWPRFAPTAEVPAASESVGAIGQPPTPGMPDRDAASIVPVLKVEPLDVPVQKSAEPQTAVEAPPLSASPARDTPARRSPVRRAPAATTRKREAASASLEVVVMPFGKVWVDGQLRGEAPVSLELSSGVHRVQVGRKTPSLTRKVSLRPAEHRQLVLKL